MDNEKILKIIESSHFNFLIGSGASRNYLETLKNIEDLLTQLDGESAQDKLNSWFRILDVSIKNWYFDKCIRGNLRLVDDTFVLSENKTAEFNQTNDNYCKLLQSLNILLLKRRNKLLPKEVNVFTTNMDIFIDICLDNLGLEFNDGFSGKFTPTFNTANYQKSYYKNSSQYNISSELPLFNLFKLHGSLTWDKSTDGEIRYDADLCAMKDLNKLIFSTESLVSLIKTVEGKDVLKSYQELKNEAVLIELVEGEDAALKTFADLYDKLVMINPTKEKFENTTLRLEYYEQMRMYSNILERENSVLFVTGFSFADEHIRQITFRALNSNPTLLIVVFNFSDQDKEAIEMLFPKLKYKNLFSEFIGYDFKKVVEDVFYSLAGQFDHTLSVVGSDEQSVVQQEELKNGESAN